MKGFPFWPGRVAPTEKMSGQIMRKGSLCVYFFGSRNYAAIMPEDLKPYAEFKEKFVPASKRPDVKRGIEELERYLAGAPEEEDSDEDDEEKASSEEESVQEVENPKDVGNSSSVELHNDEIAEAEFEALVFGGIGDVPIKKSDHVKAKKRPLADAKSPTPRKKFKIRAMSTPISQPKLEPANDEKEVTQIKEKQKKEKAIEATKIKQSASKLQSPKAEPATQRQVVETTRVPIGFLGLGHLGSEIIAKLIGAGHDVAVWNDSKDKDQTGAKTVKTPRELVSRCDVIFSCLDDPQSVKQCVFGNDGAMVTMTPAKAYIEMTGIDANTSEDVAEAIKLQGGRYLEAQIQGNKTDARNSALVILAAGDRSVYDECASCFQSISKKSFYLGKVGSACNMNLLIQALNGVLIAGLGEIVALGGRAGLEPSDILNVVQLTSLNSVFIRDKIGAFSNAGKSLVEQPLHLLQKDLHLTVGFSQRMEQPIPMTSAANEVLKSAAKSGCKYKDASAVYQCAKL